MSEHPHGYGDSHTLEFPSLPKLGEMKPEQVSSEPPEQFEPHDFTD